MADSNSQNPTPRNPLVSAIQVITGPWTRENLISWVLLIGFILVFSWAGFQQFTIPSGSMEPTLLGDPRYFSGDRVIVNKWLYGLRVPFMNKRIWKGQEPQRWDIVVFHAVQENAEHGTLIKRIVGLPGERVHINENGDILINGEVIQKPPSMDGIQHTDASVIAQNYFQQYTRLLSSQDQERLKTDPVFHANAWIQFYRDVELLPRYGILEEEQYTLIPEDHYFLLGDNSNNSTDGRFWGWVPNENILGKATSVWWPLSHRKDLTGWTKTLWGMLFLYGVPGLFLLYVVTTGFIVCSHRVNSPSLGGRLSSGDHILINRLRFGIRFPFTTLRITKGRPPVPGEPVAFIHSDSDRGPQVGLGIFDPKGKKSKDASIRIRFDNGTGESGTADVDRSALLGIATRVWWPPSRRTALDARSQTEHSKD